MTMYEVTNRRLLIGELERVMDRYNIKGVDRSNCYYYARGIMVDMDMDMPSKYFLFKTTALLIVKSFLDLVDYPSL